MNYLSICSGIEAATVAWHPLGWKPVGFAEVEPFPSAVLAHHYPDVPNHGDMTRYEDWNLGTTDLDLLVGGTPCQAFSVAGLRKGLEDHRGNLTLTFIDLADHFDPEWIVWENVPGVLSSKDNAFGCFLAGLCGAGEPFTPDGRWAKSGVVSGPKRTVAWRVLDAQYFGVAQRRRRVFVVAVRGAGNWASAAALFPVGQSLHWNTAPSRKARQGITCSPEGIAGNVSSKWSKGSGGPAGDEHYNLIAPVAFTDVSSTLKGGSGERGYPDPSDGNGHGLVASAQAVAYGIDSHATTNSAKDAVSHASGGPRGLGISEEIAPTLRSERNQAVAFTQNTRDEVRLIGGDGQITGALAAESGMKQTNYVAQPITVDVCPTLRAGSNNTGGDRPPGTDVDTADSLIAYMADDYKTGGYEHVETARPLTTSADRTRAAPISVTAMQVRRLTPEECEKLQGFPRSYTNIPWRGKPESPDGPRYRALGNSMAVPCMRWIGQRIELVRAIEQAHSGM